MPDVAVLALGGNAILPKGSSGNIHSQFARVRESIESVITLMHKGYEIVITHGNGPQAGNELIRNELGFKKGNVPYLPLGIIVASTEGWMGYMIEQSLQNLLIKKGIKKDVVTIPTQVLVSREDTAWKNPTKPIGPFLNKEEARSLDMKGIDIIEDAGRGYRRVVPSPTPLAIIEKDAIKKMLTAGMIVIAVGGGGMPVYKGEDGTYEGLEGVIDKDLASSILGKDIGAKLLMMLTSVPEVYINFEKKDQKVLQSISVKEARQYLEQGEFPSGSMGPKIRASIDFLQSGGEKVIITSVDLINEAINGERGTTIIK